MEEKKLTYKDAPWGYPLCFNNECSLRDRCMHYQVGLLAPADKLSGAAVYPAAWSEGNCRQFREKRMIRMAWGFDNLYKNLPRRVASQARTALRLHLGTGMSAYYRYHHGERLIPPQLQEDILGIMAQYTSTEGMEFDHYVETLDFT